MVGRPAMEDALTTSEVARILKVSTTWVIELGDRGDLRFHSTKLGRLYEKQEVERVVKKRNAEKRMREAEAV
jgi:excisionase family DNA binding protein